MSEPLPDRDARVRRAAIATAVAALAYLGVWIWGAVSLPARVPVHFGAGGQADNWSSRGGFLIFSALLALALFGGLTALGWFATGGNATGLNLPHKDYWLAPERRAAFRVSFFADMLEMAALTGALITLVVASVTQAGVAGLDALPAWWFVVPLVLYLAAIAWWLVAMLRRYRPPLDQN